MVREPQARQRRGLAVAAGQRLLRGLRSFERGLVAGMELAAATAVSVFFLFLEGSSYRRRLLESQARQRRRLVAS